MRALLCPIAIGLCVLISVPVEAETLRTPVDSVPFTITRPGIYCLTRQINVTSELMPAPIVIDANNVVLDLNGWTLRWAGAGQTEAVGVASSQRRNVTVKNGTAVGFKIGIDLHGNNNLVEGTRVDQSTEGGIQVLGHKNIIRDNHVLAVNRTQGLAWGIYIDGERNVIMNNDVTDVSAPDDNEAGIILSNVSGNGRDFLAVNNRITGMRDGIRFEHGASGKYRDNLTSGVLTPFSGGTDAGGNN